MSAYGCFNLACCSLTLTVIEYLPTGHQDGRPKAAAPNQAICPLQSRRSQFKYPTRRRQHRHSAPCVSERSPAGRKVF